MNFRYDVILSSLLYALQFLIHNSFVHALQARCPSHNPNKSAKTLKVLHNMQCLTTHMWNPKKTQEWKTIAMYPKLSS